MSKQVSALALVLAGSLGGVPAAAQTQASAPEPTTQQAISKNAGGGKEAPASVGSISYTTVLLGLNNGLQAQVELLRARLRAAKVQFEHANTQYKAGLTPASELQKAQAEIEFMEICLRDAESKLQKELRLSVLERPITVRFSDASLRQATLALTEAAGMPVLIDAAVPADKRLTLAAQGVTFGLVLETVAQKAGLMIAPDPKGLRISAWPVLEVNGERMEKRSNYSPWSEEWVGYLFYGGQNAAASTPFASGGGVVFSRGGPDRFGAELPPLAEPAAPVRPTPPALAPDPHATGPAPLPGAPPALGQPRPSPIAPDLPAAGMPLAGSIPTLPHGMGGGMIFPGMLGGGSGSGLTLAPIGDRNVVVAEPGANQAGEPGYWLTVYRLDGDRLRKVSSLFHKGTGHGVMVPGMGGIGQFGLPGGGAPGLFGGGGSGGTFAPSPGFPGGGAPGAPGLTAPAPTLAPPAFVIPGGVPTSVFPGGGGGVDAPAPGVPQLDGGRDHAVPATPAPVKADGQIRPAPKPAQKGTLKKKAPATPARR